MDDAKVNNRKLYQDLCDALKEMGYDKTPEQCKTKIHTLKRQYRQSKTLLTTSGVEREAYEEERRTFDAKSADMSDISDIRHSGETEKLVADPIPSTSADCVNSQHMPVDALSASKRKDWKTDGKKDGKTDGKKDGKNEKKEETNDGKEENRKRSFDKSETGSKRVKRTRKQTALTAVMEGFATSNENKDEKFISLEQKKLDVEMRKIDLERIRLEMEMQQKREEREHQYKMMSMVMSRIQTM
ncbi:uncharacterized protein [Haliotis asinina]|uniref:uncharacterized protein n=1 Tax=Haliotis asinina TaxID=109174 RepID=UPI00353218C2